MALAESERRLRRILSALFMAAVLLAVAFVLKPLRLPIAWAAIFAFLLAPLQSQLTQRLRGRVSAAAGVLTACMPLAIFTPLTLLGIAFARQVTQMALLLKQQPRIIDLASLLDSSHHPRIAALIERFTPAGSSLDIEALQQYVREHLQQWVGTAAGLSGQLVLDAAGGILRFCLMLFILFFMLRDGPAWFARMAQLLPLQQERRSQLFIRLGKVTRAVVYGCGVTAALQGTMVGIGFAITGISGPVVFGVLAAVSALLPFGGAALVWVPGVLYLLGSGHIGLALFLLAWGGIVSTSDNFIRPWIISRYTPVPTLLVFLGVIGGVATMGLIGFVLGPLVLVLATELLRFTEESLVRRD